MAFFKARKKTGLVVTVEGEAEGCIKLIVRSEFKCIPNKCLL